jgi:hypothetical protein
MKHTVPWIAAAAVLALSSCGSSATTNAGPAATAQVATQAAAPDASSYVVGIGDVSVLSLPDGDPGSVTVIAAAKTLNFQGSVNLVVRNNTSAVVGEINVSGTARDDTGALVGSGSSQGFQPKVVAPGEIAFGYVYFDVEQAGSAWEFNFDVAAEPVGDYFLPVTITEINNTGGQIIGAVTNDLDRDVSGSIEVVAICFDTGGRMIDAVDSYVEQDDLPPGGTGSFAIDLYRGPCPVGLVAASGHGS